MRVICLALFVVACSSPSSRVVASSAADATVSDGVAGDDVPPVEPDIATVDDVVVPPEDTAWVDLDQPLPDLPEAVDVPVDAGPSGPDVVIDPGLCSPAGGALNIYDLQNTDCPDHPNPEPTAAPGYPVELQGVVVTGIYSDTFFVQEPAGGPYSGIGVYTHGLSTKALKVGSVVTVIATYTEYFESTQLYLSSFEVTGETTPLEPYVAEDPVHLSTDHPASELFEGVLVKVLDVKTIHTKPDCPEEYGEFMVTGGVRVDDMGTKWTARLGDEFASITGPLNYTFGNFKIEPRDEADIVVTKTGGVTAISKCIATECQVPDTKPGTKALIINEIMADPFANDSGQEWIELFNPGQGAVDLTGWELRDCGAQAWPIVGADLVVGPGEYMVLGMDANPAVNGGADVSLAYGTAFYLPNTVGSVLLFDGSGSQAQLIDQTRYSRFSPWDFDAGKSLERITPQADGTKPESWVVGSSPYGPTGNMGTPGEKNDSK